MDTTNDVAINSVIDQELLLKIVNSVDINELDLTIRTEHLLRRIGIDTIGKLCSKTKLDLLAQESLLYISIREAEKKLSHIGLNLKPLGFPIATRNDWKRFPVSDVSISFDIDLQLSDDQYNKLKRGNIPLNMDDKWFIYYEKGKLHFYRSVTGLCIFSVELNVLCHKHHVKTYVYDLDNIKTWKEEAPEIIKLILRGYSE